MAGINLTASLDTAQVKRGFEEIKNRAKQATSSVVTDAERMDTAMMSLGRTIAKIGGTAALIGLGRQIVNITGEFQQLHVAFTTLLQSREKADKLMAEMVDLAARTPFDLQGVANGARQLLAYGFAAEDITDTLTRLGNVAAGLGLPLERLTYLYGTTLTQGRLYTRDLLQFTSSGIPMLQGLADEFNTTSEEVLKMVEAGKIGFPEVQKVLNNLTNEGGKFFDLMKEQSKTITGQISNLGDAFEVMLNEIGSSQKNVISGALSGVTYLVENYEKVISLLVTLVATYGTYKAALMVMSVTAKGWTVSMMLQYKWTLLVEKAQKLLNATILKNPYAFAFAALAGLVTAIIAFRDRTTEAEKAQQKFNEKLAEEKKLLQERKEKTEALINAIHDETLSDTERIMSYQELQSMYPALFKNMAYEEFLTKKYTEAKKTLNEELAKENKLRLQQNYESAVKRMKELPELINEAQEKLNKPDVGIKNTLLLKSGIYLYRKELIETQTAAEGFREELDKINRAEEAAQPKEIRIASLQGNIDLLKQQIDQINKLIDNAPSALAGNLIITRDSLLKRQASYSAALSGLTTGPQNESYGAAYNKAKKEWEAAKSALSAIEKDKDKFTQDQYQKAVEREKTAKEAYSALGGVVDKKEQEKQLKSQEELSKLILENDKALEQSRIDILREGKEKELAEIEQRSKEKIQAIEEARKKEEAASGGQLAMARQTVFDEQVNNANTEAANARAEIELKYAKEYDEVYKQLTDTALSETARRTQGLKDQFTKMREWVDNALKGGSITEAQAAELTLKIDKTEVAASLKAVIDEYGSAQDKITEIQERAEAARKAATEAGRKDLIANIDKNEKEQIGEVKVDELMRSDDWINLFQNLDALSSKEIRRIIDHINEQLKNAKLDPINLKATTEQLEKAKKTADQKNPFTAVVSGFKAYKLAMEEAIKLRQEYNKTQKEEDKKAADQADIDALKEKSKAWGAVADAVSYTTATLDGVTSIASALGADEDTVNTLNNLSSAIGGVGQAAVGFATGDIASGIAGVGQALTGIINLFNNDRKREKRIKNLQDEIDALTRSTEKLNKASEKTYSTKSANTIREQNKMLQRQQELIQKQIKEEEGKKNVDKDRIKDWKNDLDDINETIQDNTERIREAIAGISFDSFRDNFLDALTDMSIGSEEFAQEFDKMLQKSFYDNLLATKYDDQIRALYNRWAELGENGLTETEVERLRREQERLAEQIMADRDKYSEIFGWKNEAEVNNMKGQISASVTEETFSKSLGIQRLHVDLTKENGNILKENNRALNLLNDIQQKGWSVVSGISTAIGQIQVNTLRTANNTDILGSVDKRLRDIEQNTRTKYYGK